eukprot:Hpha_TRINITY_DN15296_c2_g1::TRINITY_DN15296_c2_g1_i1::g.66208::m.66208/K18041/PTP4A; protein tyrosine phosphatase type IVA
MVRPTGFGATTAFRPVNSTLVVWDEVRGKRLNFLILEQPTPSSLADYIATLKMYRVTHLVRVHDTNTGEEALAKEFTVLHGTGWSFPDGESPPPHVVRNWLQLVDDVFGLRRSPVSVTRRGSSVHLSSHDDAHDSDTPCIAVHCGAGLGRAPVLVAVALMERGGAKGPQVVEHIRSLRWGCFNGNQVDWLLKYRVRGNGKGGCCCVM